MVMLTRAKNMDEDLESKNAGPQGFDFWEFDRKIKIKLYLNYKLLSNME